MKKHLSILALTVGISLVSGLAARAQLTANESFNYDPGSGVISTEGTGGTGWAFAWNSKTDTTAAPVTQVAAGSLSYTDGSGNTVTTSGGSLISSTTTATTGQPERALTTATSVNIGSLAAANTAAPGTLWMSYLWQGLNTTGPLYRQSIMMFINGATTGIGSGSERLDIGMPNISTVNSGTINPNISLWTSGGISGGNTYSSTAPLQSTLAANSGLTTFVLIKFTVDTATTTADTVNVWLNPTLGVVLGTPSLTYASQDLTAINAIRIQSGSLNTTYGTVGGSQQVDEIHFGYTGADVECIPEPAIMALAGLGGLALLALRRKQ
jgi:hypothetical protein